MGKVAEEGRQVLTGDGKSNHQGDKLLKVNVAVAVAVQILHDFVHSSGVLLRLQGREENTRVVSSGYRVRTDYETTDTQSLLTRRKVDSSFSIKSLSCRRVSAERSLPTLVA
ncbi:hypothetical protein EYF80_047153 [Liparis tanakae]|uniref:Uncharacterized protein n=1 Tax=Liparis tanakae TaxID=230148 RepID=A0A4Z2FN37_9TELE|nr:hypothetical protein EYF80_047153 [Liparis tanakae]